jgi:hypothetical protein
MSLLHLAGLPALAFIYTPEGYVHHGRLYQTCQGGDQPSDAIHEPPRRGVLGSALLASFLDQGPVGALDSPRPVFEGAQDLPPGGSVVALVLGEQEEATVKVLRRQGESIRLEAR